MSLLFAAMPAFFYLLAVLLGLCMGSFLYCFAYRYASRESARAGCASTSHGGARSKCVQCGNVLGAFDLFPVFSWLLLRGKCRYCGCKISARYPIAELVCALVYVSVIYRCGLTTDTLRYLLLFTALYAATLTDLTCGLIPDRLTVVGAIGAFIFACFSADGSIPAALLSTLVGGLSISLPLLLLVLMFDRLMKRDTMGGGDIKLTFLIGLYFDWRLNLFILISACIFGLVFALIRRRGKQDGAFSFAPALAAAAWVCLLCGQQVLDWYLGLFNW